MTHLVLFKEHGSDADQHLLPTRENATGPSIRTFRDPIAKKKNVRTSGYLPKFGERMYTSAQAIQLSCQALIRVSSADENISVCLLAGRTTSFHYNMDAYCDSISVVYCTGLYQGEGSDISRALLGTGML